MRKILVILVLAAASVQRAAATESELLNRIARELAEAGGRGTAWELTSGNELPPGWLLPTTDRIPGELLAQSIREMISRAQKTVDMTLMAPAPAPNNTDAFSVAIRSALADVAKSGHAVAVRILIGNPNFAAPEDVDALLKFLEPAIRGSSVSVMIAAMTTCMPPVCGTEAGVVASFNHAKIVAVDGKEAIVGGHNLWSGDYAMNSPIYDLSMRVRGPAAQAAANFASRMWSFACAYNRRAKLWLTYSSAVMGGGPAGMTPVQDLCSSYSPSPVLPGPGSVPILAVGRYGTGIPGTGRANWQWSDVAMQRVLESATSTIRISQQDLMNTAKAVSQPVLDAIARLVARDAPGDAYVIVTNRFALSPSLVPYSWGVSPENLALEIKKRVALKMGLPENDPKVRTRVCSHLHLGALARRDSGTPTHNWTMLRLMANHSKMYMVDDHVFYIGSHNMYPITLTSVDPKKWWELTQGSLQEFGYVVDDSRASAELLKTYWEPIWEPVSRLAVTGGPGSCRLP